MLSTPASLQNRISAVLLDWVPVAGVGVAASISTAINLLNPTAAGIMAGCLIAAYGLIQWWAYATSGVGLGERVVGIRLVSDTDGKPLGWVRTLLRFLVGTVIVFTVIGGIVLLIGMMRDRRYQSWHDHLVGGIFVTETPSSNSAAGNPEQPPAQTLLQAKQDVLQRSAYGIAAYENATVRKAPLTPQKAWIPLPTPTSVVVPSPPSRQDDASSDAGEGVPQHGWYLRLDDGREVELFVPVLLGRNPQKAAGDPHEVHLVPASGDGRMISRTHVFIGVDTAGVFVVDRESTNGTALIQPEGGLQPCPAGVPVRVKENQRVSYGDRYFIVLRHQPKTSQ